MQQGLIRIKCSSSEHQDLHIPASFPFRAQFIISFYMSRIQPPYLPTHTGDVASNGSDIGLVPFTTHAIPLHTLEHESAGDRGELWIQVSTPNDLEGIKKATVNVLLQIQGKLSKCRLCVFPPHNMSPRLTLGTDLEQRQRKERRTKSSTASTKSQMFY